MARIKINDLPENRVISKKEMKLVLGGAYSAVCKLPGMPIPFPFPSMGNDGGEGTSSVNDPTEPGDDPGNTGDEAGAAGGIVSGTIPK